MVIMSWILTHAHTLKGSINFSFHLENSRWFISSGREYVRDRDRGGRLKIIYFQHKTANDEQITSSQDKS